jgi:hypothetical protein
MPARFILVVAGFALVALALPFQGCGDNDNSGPPCCAVCGDGLCRGDETSCNCGRDCGDGCVSVPRLCGDGTCHPSESHELCPADCPLDCRQCATD